MRLRMFIVLEPSVDRLYTSGRFERTAAEKVVLYSRL